MVEREILAGARELVGELEAKLREAGMANPRVEAEWLLADTLGMRRTELYLRDGPISSAQRESLQKRLSRRLSGEPLQYVLGSCDFFGHRFDVSPGVFIPRPETETLAELAIEFLRRRAAAGPAPWVLELGTGSGCLAISLAKAVPTCIVVAVELSWMALQVARTNVITHRVEHRLRIVHTDWTAGIRGRFELIVSNPPYVPDEEVRSLDGRPSRHPPRWRGSADNRWGVGRPRRAPRRQAGSATAGRPRARHSAAALMAAASGVPDAVGDGRTGDPAMSVNGGWDGMAFHRRLLADAGQLLSGGGALLMECAEGQALPLQQMGQALSWAKAVRIYEDLAGRPRGLFIES